MARPNVTKGHEYALQAVRRLLDEGFDIRYTIAGSGPERAATEGHVAALGLHGVVELAGSVSERAVLDLLHHSDIFLRPSFGLGEAIPVSVMEAMACGVPVICSTIGGTPDMITDGENGIFVSQRNVDSLDSAIRYRSGGPTERVGSVGQRGNGLSRR